MKTLSKIIFLTFILGFLVSLGLILNFFVIDYQKKLSLAVFYDTGDVIVSVFDPQVGTITTISIPKDLEVRAGRQLGTWKLGSIWKLGENERLGGKLVAETIMKTFKIPVIYWQKEGGETNLSLKQKITLLVFSIRVKNSNKVKIDLKESDFLAKTKLNDGSQGYKIVDKIPVSISALFSDPLIANKDLRVAITNATDTSFAGVTSDIAEIVEVMGAKVTSIQRVEKNPRDCSISGRDSKIIKKFAETFTCEISKDPPKGNFDIEIEIGETFIKRF